MHGCRCVDESCCVRFFGSGIVRITAHRGPRTLVELNSFQTSGISPGGCHVGILGFGTVAAAVARRLTGPDHIPNLHLTHICDRRAREKRARQPEPLALCSWTDRFDDLLASDVDVIIEAVSGAEPALDYVRAALLAGKSVVSANKQLIAHHAAPLQTLAERQGRQLRFEAAVGGAMPIVRMLADGLAGDRVLGVRAILNGTTNAVLSRMDAVGCAIDEAIAEACANGYAEEDPSIDLDGADAAAKLAIVCALAFGARVNPAAIETRTTSRITAGDLTDARQRGFTIRQIAHANYDRASRRLTAWVAPTRVVASSAFGRAEGPENVALVRCTYAGDITIGGAGAGGDALAAAIISDLVTIARDRAAIVPAPVLVEPNEINGYPDQKLAEAV
ncbi:MAG: homoserine dehydrogenase [Luteitalea sp.]|nr:homoserine dehydrogenase [Luteitalea sp.]